MISAGSCDTPGQLADPSAQTPLRCEREQQRPHLRSHRRGLGRLLGTDVAPQAGRAQRGPSDGTLQHRHPAAVRTGGDGAPVRQGAAGAHRRGGDARRRPGPGNGPYGIRGRPGLCRASGAHGSQAGRPGACTRARPGPPGIRPSGARPSGARPTGGASAAGPSVARTPVRRAPRGTRASRPSTSPSGAADAERARRAQRSQVLARRRRTTVVLFLAFTLGAVVAAVGGLGFLWAPAVPAVLLSTYIVHLRAQERRRFAFTMDRRRAEVAAQRLRENRPRRHQPAVPAPAEPDDDSEAHHPEPEPTPTVSPRRPAAAPSSSRRTTRSGWTSSVNAAASRATAGSPFPYRCPLMSPRPSPPGPRAVWRSATRRPGARPGPAPPSPARRARRTRRPPGRPGPAPAHEPVPPQPRPGPDPALRPVQRRGPAASGQRVTRRVGAGNPGTADQRRNGFPSTPVRVLEFHTSQGPVAQSGSAPRSHRGGLGFKSPQVHNDSSRAALGNGDEIPPGRKTGRDLVVSAPARARVGPPGEGRPRRLVSGRS